MRTTVNDLSRDTKTLNIQQLDILNSDRKQSLLAKINWNLLIENFDHKLNLAEWKGIYDSYY